MVLSGDFVLLFTQIKLFFCEPYQQCPSFTALQSLLSERREILHHVDMPQTSNEDQLTRTKTEARYICACPNYLANNNYTGKEQIDEDKTEELFPHKPYS